MPKGVRGFQKKAVAVYEKAQHASGVPASSEALEVAQVLAALRSSGAAHGDGARKAALRPLEKAWRRLPRALRPELGSSPRRQPPEKDLSGDRPHGPRH